MSSTIAEISRLRDLRGRLLHLHKVLLDLERQDYEKASGQVNSAELLQLVINHPQFAWLRMLSALVVEIDEALDSDEAPTREVSDALVSRARSLLGLSENDEFGMKYQAALQREPAVVMAHSSVMQVLRQDR